MFSLIITLVAILLVIALALATIYYGSSAYTSSRHSAAASKILNEVAQVRGAAVAHHAHTQSWATTLDALVSSNYLQAVPSATQWTVYEGAIAVSDVHPEVCNVLNEKAGVPGVPQCSEVTSDMGSVCCEEA